MSEERSGASPAAMPTMKPWVMWVRFFLFAVLFAVILFGSAGRLDIPAFWAYWGLWVTFSIGAFLVVHSKDPSLVRERARPGPGGKDPYLRIFGLVFFLAHWIVAGLDVGRYHWSDEVPPVGQIFGFVGLAVGLGLWTWAMAVNRFFSSEARIQRDRGHQVISDGPYQFIRHPGYLSAILMCVCSPLGLGSYVSGLPTLALIPFFFRRLWIEERLLLAELEGYAEYAQRVRFRLLPGVW